MSGQMDQVLGRILADIQKRIDAEPDEARRLAHVKDREIVRHHFVAVGVRQVPAVRHRRIFSVNAAGGCMEHADGAVRELA